MKYPINQMEFEELFKTDQDGSWWKKLLKNSKWCRREKLN
jgi:hypothetical protein